MSKGRTIPGRVLRSHRQAQQTYNQLSGLYDWLSSSETPFKEQALHMLAARPREKILEVGCGTGQLLPELASQTGAAGQVVGIDLSYDMLAIASRRLREAGTKSGGKLHIGDGVALPYSLGCFDAVLMTFVLELFDTPEISSVLAECRRVLRKGGRLCVAGLILVDQPNLMTRAYEWFHRAFPAWADCRPIPLQAFLADAGFITKDIWHGSMWGLPVGITLSQLQATPKQQDKIDQSNGD